MDIKEIYIKNFRNIGEEGAKINLSPITIFTGCNSAGKSTAAKALLLLESYLSDIKANNYNLIDTPLDFSKVVKLGTFDTVLNSSAKAKGQESFVLGYSFESAILVADIAVRLTFGKNDLDALNNAWLHEVTILIDSEELLSIRIIDGHYSFDIKNKEKLIEYIRCYKIRHIVSTCESYDITRRENEEWNLKYQNNSQTIEDDWEAIRAYIPEIKSIEKQLISDSIIRDRLNSRKKDKLFKEPPSLSYVISAIEDIVEFGDIWGQAYEIEKYYERRLIADDVDQIKNPILQNFMAQFKSLKDSDKKWKDEFDRMCERVSSNLMAYVNSDSKNISEYKRARNCIVLDDFINKINEIDYQEWAIQFTENSGKNIGILGIVSSHKSERIGYVCKYLLQISLNPYLLGRMGYVDASTVDVKRIYPLDFSDRFGNLWKRFNDEKQCHHWFNPIQKGDFLRTWLREFNICEDIKINNIEGALLIKLISSDVPDGRPLADFGYGITQLVSLLLNIEIAINHAEYAFMEYLEEDDDYDLPLDNNPYFLILEEPEVHLHPNLQSRLADLFLDAENHGVHFIVETHSEYIVRRSQVIVASMFDKNPKYIPSFGVYYFPNDGRPYDMRYKTNGHFMESFGEGFFDEAGKWSRELMRSKNK